MIIGYDHPLKIMVVGGCGQGRPGGWRDAGS